MTAPLPYWQRDYTPAWRPAPPAKRRWAWLWLLAACAAAWGGVGCVVWWM